MDPLLKLGLDALLFRVQTLVTALLGADEGEIHAVLLHVGTRKELVVNENYHVICSKIVNNLARRNWFYWFCDKNADTEELSYRSGQPQS